MNKSINKKKIGSILLLGGESSRFKSSTNKDIKKQYLLIDNKPVFIYTLLTFLNLDDIDHLFLVIPKDDKNYVLDLLKEHNLDKYLQNSRLYLVEGGEIRQDSVFNALSFIKEKNINLDYILIHDSVRPLIDKSIILNHINNINNSDNIDALITINDINDSIISLNNDNSVNYLNRNEIKLIQTPQTFKFIDIFNAYYFLKNNDKNTYISFKDDYSLFIYYYKNSDKKNTLFIKGDILNFKLTSIDELKLLEYIFGNKRYGTK